MDSSQESTPDNAEYDTYEVPSTLEFKKKVIRPPGIPLTRKRLRNPSNWKSEKAKRAKQSGTSGTSKTGAPIDKKTMGVGCDCRFSCTTKISSIQRREIFEQFWNIKEHSRQWDYIARHVESKSLAEKDDVTKKKKFSYSYFLQVSFHRIKVCQTMFLHTLGKYYKNLCYNGVLEI